MKRVLAFFLAAATLLAADRTFAQVGTIQDIKLGPGFFHQSDVVNLSLNHHRQFPNPPWAGWAGYKFTVHVLDNTEVDVDAVTPNMYDNGDPPVQVAGPPTINPFGPRSNNVVSVPREWKTIHPAAANSGINVSASHVYNLGLLGLHIKGTDNPAQNSDTDVAVQVWNIWHFRQGYTSIVVPLLPSDRIWVQSQMSTDQLPHGPASSRIVPPNPYPVSSAGGLGHWLHVQQPGAFHMFGSQFYATLADTITIGIEHIPEPTTVVLTGFGVVCAVMGVRSYRKRRA